MCLLYLVPHSYTGTTHALSNARVLRLRPSELEHRQSKLREGLVSLSCYNRSWSLPRA